MDKVIIALHITVYDYKCIKTHGSESRGQENAHVTTDSLYTCSKMFKKRKTKLTFRMLQSFLCSSNNFITFFQ